MRKKSSARRESESARQAGNASFAACTAWSTSSARREVDGAGLHAASPGCRRGRVRPDCPSYGLPPIQWLIGLISRCAAAGASTTRSSEPPLGLRGRVSPPSSQRWPARQGAPTVRGSRSRRREPRGTTPSRPPRPARRRLGAAAAPARAGRVARRRRPRRRGGADRRLPQRRHRVGAGPGRRAAPAARPDGASAGSARASSASAVRRPARHSSGTRTSATSSRTASSRLDARPQRPALRRALGPPQHGPDGRRRCPGRPTPTSTRPRPGTSPPASRRRRRGHRHRRRPRPTPTCAANTWRNPGESRRAERTGRQRRQRLRRRRRAAGTSSTTTATRSTTTATARTSPARSRAVGDNGLGVAGVDWRVRIMALKFLDADGAGTTADAVEALLYAAANGAASTNNSWGGGELLAGAARRDRRGRRGRDALRRRGRQRRRRQRRRPALPGRHRRCPTSSRSPPPTTATSAPGSPTTAERPSTSPRPARTILSTWPGSGYRVLDGTSMATPHVSGAAALAKAAFPQATAAGLKALLLAHGRRALLARRTRRHGRAPQRKRRRSLRRRAPGVGRLPRRSSSSRAGPCRCASSPDTAATRRASP